MAKQVDVIMKTVGVANIVLVKLTTTQMLLVFLMMKSYFKPPRSLIKSDTE